LKDAQYRGKPRETTPKAASTESVTRCRTYNPRCPRTCSQYFVVPMFALYGIGTPRETTPKAASTELVTRCRTYNARCPLTCSQDFGSTDVCILRDCLRWKDLPTRELYPIVVRRGSSRTRKVLLTRASRSFANTRFFLVVLRSKTLQDAPKTPPRRNKTPQDAPKTRQDAPKTAQDAAKTLPRRPKTLPRRPKTPQDRFLVPKWR